MATQALIEAVKSLSLPEDVVRSVMHEYMGFLEEKFPERKKSLDDKLMSDKLMWEKLYQEAQGSMLASTLILTMENGVDMEKLLFEVYGRQEDADLLAMRKELVSRAVSQAKDAAALAGLSYSEAKKRKAVFCQE